MKHPPSQQTKWPENAIFTVGHSTLPIERFIALLDTYGIERLVDVRTVPRSRHNPQFNAEDLGRALQQEDIDYVPLPALGGLRHAACAQGLDQHGLAQHKFSRLRRLYADRRICRAA